jgi:hypothetical protein
VRSEVGISSLKSNKKEFFLNERSVFPIPAYVNGKESGIMLEKPLHQYKSYDGQSDLDISEELGIGRGEAQGVSLQECFRRYYKMHHEDDWYTKVSHLNSIHHLHN